MPRALFFFMSKDPAFLFYSSDFLTGTTFMSYEQTGLYIKMLCIQHQHGGRIDTNELRTQCERIANGDAVYKKFKHDETGSYNERLSFEMEKRKNKGLKASESASKRWNKEQPKELCERNANAMRSENENENINEFKTNKVTSIGKKFEYNEVAVLPENYIQSCREQLYATQRLTIDKDTILKLWEAFRLEKITGEIFYSSEKDIFLHFVNWIKKQKFSPTKIKSNGTDWRTELTNKTLKELEKYKGM